jgi:hypothetical protein
MERTLIAINLPNIVSIAIAGALGYLLITVIAQILMSRSPVATANAAGF